MRKVLTDLQKKIKTLVVSVSLLIGGALSLVAGKAYVLAPFIVFIVSVSAIFERYKSSINRDDLMVVLSLLIYFLVGLLDTLYHGQDWSNMDLFVRYVVAAWLLYYLARYNFDDGYLWYGYALGAILVGAYAVYAKFYLGMYRVETSELNSIHFGNLSMMLGVFCLAGVFWANCQRHKKSLLLLMLFASGLAMTASLLSGTRSGWVGLPLVLFALYSFFSDHFPKRYVVSGFFGGLALLLLIIFIPQTHVIDRVAAAVSDVKNYLQGNSSTSVGLRFEMWKSGYLAFIEKPVLGWGEEDFYAFQKGAVDKNSLNPLILNFNHLHNQYIEELAKRGLIGFLAFLVLLAIPLRLFLKRMRSKDDRVRALAAAGVMAVICMADFCLTQAMLRINSGVMFFIFNLVFIWSLMRSRERFLMQENLRWGDG